MTIREGIVLVITGIGVLFMLISAIGILRLPDVFTRMHANGKAATLGISCLLLAAGIYYPAYFGRMVVLVILFFVTAPIATTAMARAAYRVRSPKENFVLYYDEMKPAPDATTTAEPSGD
jgi:multicomponent Na+:H+ antiporter subunit G